MSLHFRVKDPTTDKTFYHFASHKSTVISLHSSISKLLNKAASSFQIKYVCPTDSSLNKTLPQSANLPLHLTLARSMIIKDGILYIIPLVNNMLPQLIRKSSSSNRLISRDPSYDEIANTIIEFWARVHLRKYIPLVLYRFIVRCR